MAQIVPNYSGFGKRNRLENPFESLCWASSANACWSISWRQIRTT